MRPLVGLMKASHFGPTVVVVTSAFLLALSQLPIQSAARIALAIFAGQLVVGWSNDVIDYPLDMAAERKNKPLVSSLITEELLKRCLIVAIIAAAALSLCSPLGLKGSLIHFLGIGSAVAYNFKLKATVFSPLPYIISFGALPWAIFLADNRNPPAWLYIGFACCSVAFHFLNVLKDLEWDLRQGILGLPQRLGRNKSLFIAALLVVVATLNALFLRS